MKICSQPHHGCAARNPNYQGAAVRHAEKLVEGGERGGDGGGVLEGAVAPIDDGFGVLAQEGWEGVFVSAIWGG